MLPSSIIASIGLLWLKSLPVVTSALTPAASLATQYAMTTSTSMPFPTATQSASDALSFVTSQWSLSKGNIQDGANDIAFVSDPFPNSPVPGSTGNETGPVLQITYPQGSYSHNTGGAQWYSLWNTSDGSTFDSMILSYEIAFDSNFNWVQGGKLPGLRGGPDVYDCSGGNQPNGSDCFSARLMWRKNGAGEVYTYMLTPNNICGDDSITCNSDFGVSIDRGAFGFVSGQWSRVTLVVQLNNPPNVANGNIMLFFNDVQGISQGNLQLRGSTDINIGGLYFSTFFGGSDSSWATPQTTHTYFRNFQMWGSSSPSNLTGQKVSGASHNLVEGCSRTIVWFFALGLILLFGL